MYFFNVPSVVAQLDVTDRGDDLREERARVRILRLLKQLGVFVAQRRRAHVAQAYCTCEGETRRLVSASGRAAASSGCRDLSQMRQARGEK